MNASLSPVLLCRLDELPDGASRGFDPCGEGRDSVFLVRQGAQVYGWLDACPHIAGAPMAWRKNAYLNRDGSRIVCSAHGASFDIATGLCLQGPCIGQRLTAVACALSPQGEIHLQPGGNPAAGISSETSA